MKQRAWVALGALWLGVVSCRQIIGIEQAEEDPALSAQGGTRSALSAGADAGTAGDSPREQGGAAGAENGGQGAGGAGGEAAASLAGAGAGAGGEAGALSAPSLCERYCSAVTANCSGIFAVYTSYSTCLSVCAWLPEGVEGAKTGNSVQCRLRAAQIAKDEVPHYCPIAGPGGSDVCGANCESLCALRAGVCKGFGDGDTASCLSECGKLPDAGSYSTDLDVGQYAGPHVQCRLYHVSAAAADDPEQHCPHANGAAPCN